MPLPCQNSVESIRSISHTVSGENGECKSSTSPVIATFGSTEYDVDFSASDGDTIATGENDTEKKLDPGRNLSKVKVSWFHKTRTKT